MRIRYVIVMLLLLLASAIHAQDYTTLEDGKVIENSFEAGVYAHLYTFMATEGDTVTISMNRLDESKLDSYLILLDASGAVLAVNDDATGILWNAQIADFEIPETGTYLLVASHAGYILQSFEQDVLDGKKTMSAASYNVLIQGNNEDDNLEFELDTIDLLKGETVTIEITEELPLAYAAFEAEADDVLTISTLSGNEDAVDTLMYLVSPEGEFIAFNDDGENVEQFYSALTAIEIPEDGVYLVLVSGYGFYNVPDRKWENVGIFSMIME